MKHCYALFFLVLVVGTYSQAQTWQTFNKATTSTVLPNDNVTSAVKDIDGTFWFGTDYGVSHYNGISWKNYTVVDGLAHNLVHCIAIDKQGVKWFGTEDGVSKFDGNTWTTYLKSPGTYYTLPVSSIAIEPNGTKWIGTPGTGVHRFDDHTWTDYGAESFRDPYINAIVVDSLGVKWFGTRYGTLTKFDNVTWTNYTLGENVVTNEVTRIFLQKGNKKWITGVGLYPGYYEDSSVIVASGNVIGIDDAGIQWKFSNPGVAYLTPFPDLPFQDPEPAPSLPPSTVVYCLLQDTTGKRWFGTSQGIWTSGSNLSAEYSKNYTNNSPLPEGILAIAVDSKKRTWIEGGPNGLSRFDDTIWTTVDSTISDRGFAFPDAIVFDEKDHLMFLGDDAKVWLDPNAFGTTHTYFAKDAHGVTWFGDVKGNLGKIEEDTVTSYVNPFNSGERPVEAIAVDLEGNIWLDGEGFVAKFDGVSWHSDSLFPSTLYYALAIDQQDDKWVGTSIGLIKSDDKKRADFHFPPDFPSVGVTDIKVDAADTKWVATTNGVYKFDGVAWTRYTQENGLANNRVTRIYIDDFGNKWFLTDLDGVSKLSDGGTPPFRIFSQLKRGMVFHDRNGNGKKEQGEENLAEQIIQIDQQFITTKENGMFTKQFPKGEYAFRYHPKDNWEMTTDSVQTVFVSDAVPNDTLYFGVKPAKEEHDVATHLTGALTRANFSSVYWLSYSNQGTYAENGAIVCVLDDRMAFVSSDPAADSVVGNRLVWNFSSLLPLDSRQVRLIAKMPNVEYLRDTLISISYASLAPQKTVALRDTLKQVLLGAYDPNDKSVKQGTGPDGNVLTGTALEYTIRFQNTGNDTAYNIVIKDSIDFNLDLQTIEILCSSHTVSLDAKGTNQVAFLFENILLPDSGKNALGSHGYVTYRIQPKPHLAENTIVTNKAYIYFDFNPPIITNETKTTYSTFLPPLVLEQTGENIPTATVSLYPNPAKDEATLLLPEVGQYTVVVTNAAGREIIKKEVSQSGSAILDMKGLPSGLYFYTVQHQAGTRHAGKFIILN